MSYLNPNKNSPNSKYPIRIFILRNKFRCYLKPKLKKIGISRDYDRFFREFNSAHFDAKYCIY